MSRQIAIIQIDGRDRDCYECGGTDPVVCSITEWTEVSEEDYQILLRSSQEHYRYRSKMPRFQVIERPQDEEAFIGKTVEEYKAFIKKEENRVAEITRKAKEARERKLKESAEKKIARLQKQLAELNEKEGKEKLRSNT